jgi:hypothetical protein
VVLKHLIECGVECAVLGRGAAFRGVLRERNESETRSTATRTTAYIVALWLEIALDVRVRRGLTRKRDEAAHVRHEYGQPLVLVRVRELEADARTFTLLNMHIFL